METNFKRFSWRIPRKSTLTAFYSLQNRSHNHPRHWVVSGQKQILLNQCKWEAEVKHGSHQFGQASRPLNCLPVPTEPSHKGHPDQGFIVFRVPWRPSSREGRKVFWPDGCGRMNGARSAFPNGSSIITYTFWTHHHERLKISSVFSTGWVEGTLVNSGLHCKHWIDSSSALAGPSVLPRYINEHHPHTQTSSPFIIDPCSGNGFEGTYRKMNISPLTLVIFILIILSIRVKNLEAFFIMNY